MTDISIDAEYRENDGISEQAWCIHAYSDEAQSLICETLSVLVDKLREDGFSVAW